MSADGRPAEVTEQARAKARVSKNLHSGVGISLMGVQEFRFRNFGGCPRISGNSVGEGIG